MKHINLRIPGELYQRLYLAAQKERKTLTATIISLIEKNYFWTEVKSQVTTIEKMNGLILNYIYEFRAERISEKLEQIDKNIKRLNEEVEKLKYVNN